MLSEGKIVVDTFLTTNNITMLVQNPFPRIIVFLLLLLISIFHIFSNNEYTQFKCMDSFVIKSDTSNRESSKTELLSYQQSFGFFDDIPDEDWKRMQEIKRRITRVHLTNLLIQWELKIGSVSPIGSMQRTFKRSFIVDLLRDCLLRVGMD